MCVGMQREEPKQCLLGIERPKSVESIMVRWLDRLWCVFEAVINFSVCVCN